MKVPGASRGFARLSACIGIGLAVVFSVRAESDGEDVYLAPETFIAEAFQDGEPGQASVLWLTPALKPGVKQILGHDYNALRIRYWRREARTAWILEEIGKVKPITTGIVVEGQRISRLQVLVYRESHGWEVKHPFFTDQFKDVGLRERDQLSEPIDGITGATLSVSALRRLVRLALYLDRQVQESSD
ncbi:FMN-binding protein [Synoicihabitans lomoniglobus]|uniref:FMN-binding protein n=1 Tax=Synoicihabitans lomoniglobus TaxID=2909285 RepID=A0AAF0CQT6_9BACT|nr:FMN-binding protein [Opitutaceae bacterium LMO-M01]WED66323.1 FMN-binding protein [Opitutaceae bacterium LMO-M01]